MKIKNSILLLVFIFFALLLLVIFFLYNKSLEISNNVSTINTINNPLPSDSTLNGNKFAFTIDYHFTSNYVLTVDLDSQINLPDDFLSYNEEDYKDFHFDFTSNTNCTITLNNIIIDIIDRNLDFENPNLTLINQIDNWYLVQDTYRNEYKIYLKINNNLTPDYLMFRVTDNDKNDIAVDNFNKLISLIHVYKLQSDKNTLSAYDLNNNLINLSDYIFIKEKIRDSLKKYDLTLKDPQTIFSSYGNEINYSADIMSGNDPYDFYVIDILPEDQYLNLKEPISEKPELSTFKNFEYNGHNYEVIFYYLTERSSHGYIIEKLSDNSYLCIGRYYDSSSTADTIFSMFKNDLL